MSLLPRFQENIGFSVSGNFKDFSSAGFDVQASWETGNEYEFASGTRLRILLVRILLLFNFTWLYSWYAETSRGLPLKFEADTFRPPPLNTCTSMEYGPEGIVFSPNENNKGGGYSCVIGTCRSQGDNYWYMTGRAGGP
jgi:hypothetical protein